MNTSPGSNLNEPPPFGVLQELEARMLGETSKNFRETPVSTEDKPVNFPDWVRPRDLARFLYKAEVHRSIISAPGSR